MKLSVMVVQYPARKKCSEEEIINFMDLERCHLI